MPHHIDSEQTIAQPNEGQPGFAWSRGFGEAFLSLWRHVRRVFVRKGLAGNRIDSSAHESVELASISGDPDLREADSPRPGPRDSASFASSPTGAELNESQDPSESPQIGENLSVFDPRQHRSPAEPAQPTASGGASSTAGLIALSDQLDSLRGRLETIERFLNERSAESSSTAGGSARATSTVEAVSGLDASIRTHPRRTAPAIPSGEIAADSPKFDSASFDSSRLDSSRLDSSNFDSLTERAGERALFDRGLTLE